MMNEDVASQWVAFEEEYSPYRLKRKDAEAIETIRINLQNSLTEDALTQGFSSVKEFEKSVIDGCIASMKNKE